MKAAWNAPKRISRTSPLPAYLSVAILLFASNCLATPVTSIASSAPVRIGFLAPFTGFLAQPGNDMLHGFKLFLSQHHNRLDGHAVRLFVGDTRAKPAVALSQLRQLVEQDHIQVLIGPLTAAVGYALENYINRHHLISIYPITGSDNITERDLSPYILRTDWASSQVSMPFGLWAYRHGYHRIATIGMAFAFSYEFVGGFQQTFQNAGGKIVAKLWPAIGQQDYSPYISRLQAAHPQAVLAVFSGSDGVRFLKQWRSFGLKIPLLGSGGLTDWSVLPSEGKAAVGVITALDYSANIHNANNTKFVAAYRRAYRHPPSFFAESTYTTGIFLQHALKATGGDVEDKSAFLNALLQARVDAPRGKVRLGPWQNPIENVYILKVVSHRGHLANIPIHVYHDVSQYWTYNPAWFLSKPVFSRNYPKCNDCSGQSRPKR